MDIEGSDSKLVSNNLDNDHNNQIHIENHNQNHKKKPQKRCKYWLRNQCNRPSCEVLRGQVANKPSTSSNDLASNGSYTIVAFPKQKNPNLNNTSCCIKTNSSNVIPTENKDQVCRNWVLGNCTYGNRCDYVHRLNVGHSFSLSNLLQDFKEDETGITLPSEEENKVSTGSKDNDVRILDCLTSQSGPLSEKTMQLLEHSDVGRSYQPCIKMVEEDNKEQKVKAVGREEDKGEKEVREEREGKEALASDCQSK